jgi:LacI family transcriptional regulator
MKDKQTPNVAVLVDTATEWGRRLIRGVTQYAQCHGSWYLWTRPNSQHRAIRLPPGWHGQGIIARVASRATFRHVTATGLPVVNVSAFQVPGVELPGVTIDLPAAARLAAEHFFDRGLAHFAYCGPEDHPQVEPHHQAFVRAIDEAGFLCHTYSRRRARLGPRWRDQQRNLCDWLRKLPKPIGILTWTNDRGQEVIHACRVTGLLVPEEVAVLAADDDPLMCEACQPPLSGIALTSEQIGFEAAALLDRLMQGQAVPERPILIEPSPVIERQSTDTLAMEDRDLALAVAFIRSHASEPIQVSDVLREVPLSRRQFERRFVAALGRTPAEEIRRAHLNRARHLLLHTEMPIPDVASAAGFASREYMAQVFRKELGVSPLRYRLRNRGRPRQLD